MKALQVEFISGSPYNEYDKGDMGIWVDTLPPQEDGGRYYMVIIVQKTNEPTLVSFGGTVKVKSRL